MIDIIFQLLIFFLVTLSMGTMEKQAATAAEGEQKENLPNLPGMKNLGEALDIQKGVILVHVDDDKDDKVPGDWIVYLLNNDIPSVEDAKKDSSHSAGPFTWETAIKKVDNELDYARRNEPDNIPRIELRAAYNFNYGYVLDLMKLCYHDEEALRLNEVVFHLARLQ
jgi:biopolymer transport protein ExbD